MLACLVILPWMAIPVFPLRTVMDRVPDESAMAAGTTMESGVWSDLRPTIKRIETVRDFVRLGGRLGDVWVEKVMVHRVHKPSGRGIYACKIWSSASDSTARTRERYGERWDLGWGGTSA